MGLRRVIKSINNVLKLGEGFRNKLLKLSSSSLSLFCMLLLFMYWLNVLNNNVIFIFNLAYAVFSIWPFSFTFPEAEGQNHKGVEYSENVP